MYTLLPFQISKTIPAGGKWSGHITRGKQIIFTAMEDGANVSLLLYNANDPAERYNMPDTLKAQHTAHLTKGNVLMSDNGRILASLTEDSLGWHDTFPVILHEHSPIKNMGSLLIRNNKMIITEVVKKTSRWSFSEMV